MFRKWKKFKVVGKKPSVQKLPAQKVPKVTSSAFDDQLKKSKKQSLRTAYGTDLPKEFYERPPLLSLSQERATKVARRIEKFGLQRIKKIRQATAKRLKTRKSIFGNKASVYERSVASKNQNIRKMYPKLTLVKRTKFGKKVKEKVEKLTSKVKQKSKIKGFVALNKMEQKLGIPVTKPKDRPTSFYTKKQDVPGRERREQEFVKRLKRDMGF